MSRTIHAFPLSILALLLLAGAASAETGFQFAAPNTRAPDDPKVNGVRFAIFHGKNDVMRGLDLGILSLSETRDLSGAAFVFGLGKVTGDMNGGAHFSLINLHSGRDSGLNAAFINKLNEADNAVDVAFLNIADGTTLLDIGGVNVSKRSTAQLGFVNVTKEITGFQFGFLNIAQNGFLPIFPIFNFPGNQGSSSSPSRTDRR